jgi:4,5-DOPA dioxygenase extradiol
MDNTKKMPVLFVGHGSPMNAIEDNEYTLNWSKIAEEIPRPKAILSVSAHWYTKDSRVNDQGKPRMIYDMYGFPAALYALKYNAEGSAEFAHMTKELVKRDVKIDNSFGIDHGTWSVLYRMYPQADIPVYQLSIDMNAGVEEHFNIGKQLSALREKGVLILGSGNVVHNLSRVDREMNGGFSWAVEFDNYVKEKITKRQYDDIIHYENAGPSSKLAFNTLEHFLPLLYVLGASREDDKLTIFNDSCTLGSLSMTCYLFM